MRFLLVLLLVATGSLSGCILLYQQDIEQGNVITKKMAFQVRTGMTPTQVRYILGTPLISDVFHKDRWDYYYARHPQGGKAAKKHQLTVYFRDGKVSRIVLNKALKKHWGDMPALAS